VDIDVNAVNYPIFSQNSYNGGQRGFPQQVEASDYFSEMKIEIFVAMNMKNR
jgi:hypothetical protein